VIDSRLVGSTDFQSSHPQGLWEGYRESRRCSSDTYPESYIAKYTSIRRQSRPEIRARRAPVAAKWPAAAARVHDESNTRVPDMAVIRGGQRSCGCDTSTQRTQTAGSRARNASNQGTDWTRQQDVPSTNHDIPSTNLDVTLDVTRFPGTNPDVIVSLLGGQRSCGCDTSKRYRGTSLIRNRPPLGTYSRPMGGFL